MDKLARKLGEELAEKLIKAGYDTPRKIKDAEDKALLALSGIGPAALRAIRAKLG